MKNNKTKKLASLVLTGILALQAGALAQEVEPEVMFGSKVIVQPRYIAIASTENDFSINGGNADCYGYTDVSGGYKAKTTVELQKKGIGWTTIKTWTKTGSGMYAEVDEDYAVASGTYRIKVTHQALSGSTVVEEKITYSDEVTK